MGGVVLWNVAMGLWLVGTIFPLLMQSDYVLKFRGVPIFRGLTFAGAVVGIVWAVVWEVRDSLIYFVIIAFVSLVHFLTIAALQPNMALDIICKKAKFTHMQPDIHKLYMGKFGGPNAIDLKMFCKLTEDRATIRPLAKGEYYMRHGTDLNALSILLSGKMEYLEIVNREDETMVNKAAPVTHFRREIHVGTIYPMDLVNHLEWIARQQSKGSHELGRWNACHMTVKALEDCQVLEWKREFLHETFKQYPQLGASVTSLIGQEIAEKAQLLAGGKQRNVPSQFVHHTYCGCAYKNKFNGDDEAFSTASEKHPEYLWETASMDDMTGNGSDRTMKLSPEQWLIRYAIGDGPWVDLSADGERLMTGLANLCARVTSDPYAAGSNMGGMAHSGKNLVREAAQPYLDIPIEMMDGEYQTLRQHQQAESSDAQPHRTEDIAAYSSLGQAPFIHVFARMASTRIPADYHPTEQATLSQLEANSARTQIPHTFGRDNTTNATGLGQGTGVEMTAVSNEADPATIAASIGSRPTLLEYVRALHEARRQLYDEIQSKKPREGLQRRLIVHGKESTEFQSLVYRLYMNGIQQQEESMPHGKNDQNLGILCPFRVDKLVVAAQNTMRQHGMRLVNARLLGVDPCMLENTLAPKNRESLVHSKYHEPLLNFMIQQLPTLHHRDLTEIINWGKWRVLFQPGTVFLRQGEFPNYCGVVLDGLLVTHTEDAMTRGRVLSHVIGPNQLVGSEDFQNRDTVSQKRHSLRTARRTVQVPTQQMLESAPAELQGQFSLQSQFAEHPFTWDKVEQRLVHDLGLEIDSDFMSKWEKAKDLKKKEENPESADPNDKWYKEEIQLSKPTVLFVWEFQDLQRLMAADPRVYSALSLMLGCDLSDKRNLAAEDSLGSMWCGMQTHAATDDGISGGMCGSREDFTGFDTLDASVLTPTTTNATANAQV